jgi:predicted permease
MMNSLFQDIRFALRQLRRSPGFTAVAVVTLALCIGSNLTIFAVVDSILLRPLPFPQSDRLVTLHNSFPNAGKDRDGASLTQYYERRGNISAFSQIASLNQTTSVIGEAGSTERIDVGRVSSEFFSTLGVEPRMGRAFTDAEMTYQTDHEVILTDEYWRQHFNADPNALGRDLRTDGLMRRVVGILPPQFRFLSSQARIFLPLSSEEGERNVGTRYNNNNFEIARLKSGATLAQAQAQIDAHNAAHAAEFPMAKEVAEAGFRTIVSPLRADHVASVRPILLLLQAGALFLLLIGGVNLVNLLLIRASGRTKELAVRQSMGASRLHVLRQGMTETVLLGLIGGLCGIIVGAAGIRLLAFLGADQLPLGASIVLDGRLAVMAWVASMLMGVLIALPIAWFNLRSRLADALQSDSRAGTVGRGTQGLRHGFVVIQIASAFVLLAGTGLLGLSLKRVMTVSPGFRSDHILTGQISLPWSSYRTVDSFVFFADRLMDTAGHQPGVSAAGMVTDVPLNRLRAASDGSVVTSVDYKPTPGASLTLNNTYGVMGDYFTAMGIPLRQGRFLHSSDSHSKEQVVVVDEEFAHRYWPQGNAVGQRVCHYPKKADDSNVYTVVGVVGAVKHSDLTEKTSTGEVYFPFSRYFARNYFVVVRTAFPPETFAETLRTVVRQTDPELPVSDLRSMETRIDDSLVARRSPALLTAVFSAVALLLAAIGTYGVLSYAVAQRRREIGVRMALGARPQQVLAYFLGVGTRLLLAGVALGALGTWAAGRAMEIVLFGVGAFQAGVLATTVGVMMLVVLMACYIPARRAARVDPMVALRYE